ncbi:bromodomain-containing protein, putative [Babesia caballi]|uniref:Bromodomain-containing protein, putative n=1 Tax=Babesia caballi TaxID=5871 RepID=A0AAV4LVA2_BABCB|nr:bromodomain-containing protein, putative [Babesia caballi]
MESGKSWRQYCVQKVLKKMRGDRFGALFAYPVLEASDSIITPAVKESYKAIIATPMDYKTVKSKLDAGVYATPDDFRDDMLLIYDNCMRFNPPVGASKWIFEAAESNKAKFEKLWRSAHAKLERLLLRTQYEEQHSQSELTFNEGHSSGSRLGASSSEAYLASSQASVEAPSVEATAMPQPVETDATQLPDFKFRFRLNLQQIQEYKARFAAAEQRLDALDPLPEALPQPSFDMEPLHADMEPVPMQHTPMQPQMATDFVIPAESTLSGLYFDETPQFRDEDDPLAEVDTHHLPPIATRREDGVLHANWLSENECNQLFPHCSIIGLHQRRPHYNASDFALRCVYNELYLSDTCTGSTDSCRDLLETTSSEDYSLKHHKLISVLLQKPVECNVRTPRPHPDFGDGDSTTVTDEEWPIPSPCDHDTVRDGGDSLPSGPSEVEDRTPSERTQTLRIELSTDATVSVGSAPERVLLKNGFRKVRLVKTPVRCSPDLTFTSENRGYYKVDETAFIYNGSLMRHVRLFLVNCGVVHIELTRRVLSLAELVLRDGSTSEVRKLFLESKQRHPQNLAFFRLPHAGATSYSPSVDVIWRLQTVANALPKPFIVLHVVCRDTSGDGGVLALRHGEEADEARDEALGVLLRVRVVARQPPLHELGALPRHRLQHQAPVGREEEERPAAPLGQQLRHGAQVAQDQVAHQVLRPHRLEVLLLREIAQHPQPLEHQRRVLREHDLVRTVAAVAALVALLDDVERGRQAGGGVGGDGKGQLLRKVLRHQVARDGGVLHARRQP